MHQTKACYVAHSSDYLILSIPLIIFEEQPLTAHVRVGFREEVGIYENQLLKYFMLFFIICSPSLVFIFQLTVCPVLWKCFFLSCNFQFCKRGFILKKKAENEQCFCVGRKHTKSLVQILGTTLIILCQYLYWYLTWNTWPERELSILCPSLFQNSSYDDMWVVDTFFFLRVLSSMVQL